MVRSSCPGLALVFLLLPAARNNIEARDLSLEQRVRAQEAIERVYYGHQIGATRPFEEAVPREALERKVRQYLKLSVALEEFWRTPITSGALQAEQERIARQTRYPDRLLEIYGALGNDPTLIRECFARPALVDRLARNFFDFDQGIHAAARAEAEDLAARLRARRLSAHAPHARRAVAEIRRSDARLASAQAGGGRRTSPTGADHPGPIDLAPDDYDRWRARAPEHAGDIGSIEEEREAFVLRVVLDETRDHARIASYRVPKVPWDVWWEQSGRDLDEMKVVASEIDAGPPPLPSARSNAITPPGGEFSPSSTCDPDDTWDNGTLDDFPGEVSSNTAIWTGSLMVVWGSSGSSSAGGRYDPVTDTWARTSTIGAPFARDHTAVWTGSAMVVWGGSFLNTGGRYDPVADTWTPTSTIGAPTGRCCHTAVWTGSRMVVWGGHDVTSFFSTGGRYDPANDSWEATSTVGAPDARTGHTAIWTGSQMVIWGGQDATSFFSTGGRYDPVSDSWTSTSIADAPQARRNHAAVWTGNAMIVWGGYTPGGIGLPGGRYDPVADAWTTISTANAPPGREYPASVWTGSRVLVWGGDAPTTNTGGQYDPATDTWTVITPANAPRTSRTAIWTGSRMIVWTGTTGGRYDPVTDTWTPTSRGSGPSYRYYHSAVWTGNVMVVWGGYDGTSVLSTGGRYDPVTDTWSPTTTFHAPPGGQSQTAVWTGNVMVVWGGLDATLRPTGGRYDPILDRWMPVSWPNAYLSGTAVWTGSRMIVWDGATQLGAQYDPTTDTWTPVSTVGAPPSRLYGSAVWTGAVMVVWGGSNGFSTVFYNTGGRYNPISNTWTATSTVNAPVGRRGHTAVWTGSRMFVWGGYNGADTNTGGLYDPVKDRWVAASTVNAPSSGSFATSVWTGGAAVVWGGTGAFGAGLGGRYDAALNSWAPTATIGAPSRRYYHTAVWTGSFMVVWDGVNGFGTGGRYALGHAVDNDGDGYTECAGDCNDGNPGVHPGIVEVCDGRDNDCDGLSDEDFGDADGDLWGNACDCAPNDPSAFAAPGEVREQEWPSDATLFRWTSLSGGSGTVYDVVRGRAGEWPVGSGPSEVCHESGSVDTMSEDLGTPAPGSAFYYLVRGRNACGAGSYGRSSSGAESVTSACP